MSSNAADHHLFTEANKNASAAYNETTVGNYDGETAGVYELVPAERERSFGNSPIQVSVKMEPEFVIHGGDGQSEESIIQVIKKHMNEMADELGGAMAEKLEAVLSNMPLKEA